MAHEEEVLVASPLEEVDANGLHRLTHILQGRPLPPPTGDLKSASLIWLCTALTNDMVMLEAWIASLNFCILGVISRTSFFIAWARGEWWVQRLNLKHPLR